MKFTDIREQLKTLVQDGCETADYIMRVSKTPEDGIYAYEELQPLVRCGDCANLNDVDKCPCGFWALENLNGFCAWGEPREGEQ